MIENSKSGGSVESGKSGFAGSHRHDEIDVPEKTGLLAKIAIFLVFAIPLVCFIVMCRFMKWL